MGIRAVANYTGKRSCHRMPGGGFDSAEELITSFNGPKVWYDLPNVATLQQDSAGTIPVTAAGDPIGRVMDISGANNHAIQATATSRPLWQTTYAGFDGTDDSWSTSAIDFTSTDKVTVVVGLRKMSDAAVGAVLELSANSVTNNGAFAMLAPANVAPNLQFVVRGTVTSSATNSAAAAPLSVVLSGVANTSALPILRTNGISTSGAILPGGGVFGNYPLFIGRRNNFTLPFNGNIYGLIIVGRAVSAPELVMLEKYMAAKVGIAI